MNNKEKYQRSFNTLRLSGDFREKCKKTPEESGKGKIMKFRSVYGISRAAAAAIAVCFLIVGSVGVSYAADLGGIRTKLGIWINGTKKDVEVVQIEDGSYTVCDENGEVTMGFGGVSIDDDGNEVPMTAEELVGYMNNDCRLEFTEDGKMIFSYKNLVEDVTDQLDSKGELHIHVDDPANENTYFNITDIEGGGYSVDSGRKPSFGKEYYEVDSTDLVIEENGYEVERDENTGYSSSVTVTED